MIKINRIMIIFFCCSIILFSIGTNVQATSRVAGEVVLYTFGEATGTTVHDVSGYGTPLNLTIADESAISWIPGSGLSIDAPTLIDSGVPATKLIEAVRISNEITIEAWIKPANTSQSGPARIVTLSDDTSNRNFTLGQDFLGSLPSDLFVVRLRTTATSNNGIPSLSSPSGTLTTDLTHVVYTRSSSGVAKIYINAIEETSGGVNGDCSNWDASYLLALGNEITEDRPWLGELHLVAIYSQVLSQPEVEQNHLAGLMENVCSSNPDCNDENDCTDDICVGGQCFNQCSAIDNNDPCCVDPACSTEPVCATSRVGGEVVLYAFGEGTGTTVYDVSGNGTPLNLNIANESAISWIPGGGLSIDAPTLIDSGLPATKVIDAVRTSNEITIEAWIRPANINQDGPARIVTLSNDTSNRNFTLAQGLWDSHPSDLFDVRMRTTTTSDNGTPSLTTQSGSLTADLIHVVYTRNASGVAKIHINATEVKSATVNGDCSNWDASYLLALGNEITEDRPWHGELHLVAIYSQSLSQLEIEQNYLIGTTETLCDDGIDNDGDGKIDCIDSDCDGLICDDGLYCTVDDTCAEGVCLGTARDCDDGEFCNGVEYCDEDNDRCEYSGNPCPWLCNEEEDLCLTPSPPPQYCKVLISPSIDTVTSGGSVEFTALTICNDVEVEGDYEWGVTSTIGSNLDESTGLYTAGENAGTDIIKVNDILHYSISATTIVNVTPEVPPLPAICDISIEPSTATIDSEGTITFTATIPEGEGCLEPDYTWKIDTDIHSKITPGTSTCFYQAGSNKTGILFTDTITVTDNANGTSTEAMVTILYGKILGVFPNVLFSSRWIPLPQIMFIIGENTRFNCTSYVTCTPNDSICVIGQIGLCNIMSAFVLVPPNTEERFVDVTVTTTNGNGEEVHFIKEDIFNINLLPLTLDEGERR